MANRYRPRAHHFDRFDNSHTQPRLSRDPCQRCGARGDVDCGHSKAQLYTILPQGDD